MYERQHLVGVVDDDTLCQFIVTRMLLKNMHVGEVIQFFNGQQAISYFLENQLDPKKLPGLILVDINMPLMNGWEFIDQLAHLHIREYNPKIYIQSSSISTEDHSKAQRYQLLSGYLIKPVSQAQVDGLINGLGSGKVEH